MLRERHQVDPEIQHGPAALGGIEEPIVRVVRAIHAEIGLQLAYLADRSVLDQLAGEDDRRLEAGPHRLHREDLVAPGGLDDVGRAGHRGGEGLLHQHRLAGVQRGDGDRVVLRVRRRDVERVDLVVAHDLRVRPVRAVDPVLVRERLGPVERAAGHGHGPGAWRVREVLHHAGGDPSRPDDAPADLTFRQSRRHSSAARLRFPGLE